MYFSKIVLFMYFGLYLFISLFIYLFIFTNVICSPKQYLNPQLPKQLKQISQ